MTSDCIKNWVIRQDRYGEQRTGNVSPIWNELAITIHRFGSEPDPTVAMRGGRWSAMGLEIGYHKIGSLYPSFSPLYLHAIVSPMGKKNAKADRPRNSYSIILALLDCKEKKRIKKKIKDALSRGEEAIEVERNAYRYLEKKKKKRKVTIVIEKSGKEKIVVRRKLSSSNERRILSSGNTGNNFTDELRT